MSTFQGTPHSRKITTTAANGKVSIAYQEVLTSFVSDNAKMVQEQPPFVPGTFLVKDYYVSKTTSKGAEEVLSHTWTRYDGVKFKDEYFLSQYCYTAMLNLAVVAVPNVGALKALSLQQAYAKLNRASWDSLVDLAEIGGTYGLVKGGLKLLASPKHAPKFLQMLGSYISSRKEDILKAAKKDKHKWKKTSDLTWDDVKRGAREGSKAAADLWLLYRYGIMPLVYSIQDALELAKKKLEKAGQSIRTVRRRPSKVSTRSTRRITAPRCTVQTNWDSRVEAIVYYRRKVDESMQTALGLTPENLPNAFWETCKLSFVWDWFFNVGDLLSALKPKFGIEVLGSTVSERHKGEISVIQMFTTMQVGSFVTAKPHVISHDSFKRTANPVMSYTPVFTGTSGLNLDRYIDSASLALQPLLKLSRKAKKTLR